MQPDILKVLEDLPNHPWELTVIGHDFVFNRDMFGVYDALRVGFTTSQPYDFDNLYGKNVARWFVIQVLKRNAHTEPDEAQEIMEHPNFQSCMTELIRLARQYYRSPTARDSAQKRRSAESR